MKTAFCNEVFRDLPLEAGFDVIAEAGYDAVELAPFTLAENATELSPKKRLELRDMITGRGLKIAGLHWLLVSPEGLHLTTDDTSLRNHTVSFLEGLIELCADLDGQVLIWGSPQQRTITAEQDPAQVRQWVIASLIRLAKRAEKCGVTFCVEPLSCDQTNFINQPNQAAELVQAAGAPPGLGIMLDTYSANKDNLDVVGALRTYFPLVKHIHVNDTNKQGPGMGTYNFEPLVTTARELGYNGYLSVEPFDYSPGPEVLAHSSRKYLASVGM